MNAKQLAVLILVLSLVLISSAPNTLAQKLEFETPAHVQQAAANVEFVNQLGGSVNSIAIRGSMMYTGIGSRMVILDISNVATPKFISQTDVLSGSVEGTGVWGNYAYVIAGKALHIIDITNPVALIPAGLYLAPEVATDVKVSGNYAYLTAGTSGLRILSWTLSIQLPLSGITQRFREALQ